MEVRIYVDGAIKARGKPECRIGMGALLQHVKGETVLKEIELSVAEDIAEGTNILAELRAIEVGLTGIPHAKRPLVDVIVITDSRWSERAIKKEYRTTAHVERQERIRETLAEFRSWRIDWVLGHDKTPGNIHANRLAQQAAGSWTGKD